jgi:hypothetical protein
MLTSKHEEDIQEMTHTHTQMRSKTHRCQLQHQNNVLHLVIVRYVFESMNVSLMRGCLQAECGTGSNGDPLFIFILPPQSPGSSPQNLNHNHCPSAKISSDGNILFLDTLSSCLLNDFRDEVPIYLYNEHKIYLSSLLDTLN